MPPALGRMPERDLGQLEPRRLVGDAQVGGQRQLQAAADRPAGDGRDRGLRQLRQHLPDPARAAVVADVRLGAGIARTRSGRRRPRRPAGEPVITTTRATRAPRASPAPPGNCPHSSSDSAFSLASRSSRTPRHRPAWLHVVPGDPAWPPNLPQTSPRAARQVPPYRKTGIPLYAGPGRSRDVRHSNCTVSADTRCHAPAPCVMRRIATGRELEVLHRVAVTLSQSLSLADVLTALTRELVFGIERAGEWPSRSGTSSDDMLVDAAAGRAHGPPAWPRGQEVNPLALTRRRRELLRPRAAGTREFRMTDPAMEAGRPRGARALGMALVDRAAAGGRGPVGGSDRGRRLPLGPPLDGA